MASSHRQRSAATGKILLLILFLCLAAGYWTWRSSYGTIGHMSPIDFNTAGYVAFLREEGPQTNLYVVKLDGTGEKKLTDDLNHKQGATWAPDGNQLCYSAEITDENIKAYQLFLFGSGGARQLTFGSGSKHMPEWRPDGKQIAFLVGGTLKVVDPNGENMEQIYPHFHKSSGQGDEESDEDSRNRPPLSFFHWSPKSEGIAGVQVAEGNDAMIQGQSDWFRNKGQGGAEPARTMDPETLVILPVGGEAVLRPETNSNKVGFSWFSDGKRLAVTMSTRSNQHGLAVIRADEPRLPPEGLFGSAGYTISPENPSVSPDGSKVAFEAWKIDSAENRELIGICVVPTEGKGPLVVKTPADIAKLPLPIKGRTTNPLWSRDGSRIIYQVTNASGLRDLWVAGVDGSHPTNLTNGKGDNFDPAVSPAR